MSFTLPVLFKFKHKYLLVGVPKSSVGSVDIIIPSCKCQNIGFINNKTENDNVVMHSTYAWMQTEVEVVKQTVFGNAFFRRITGLHLIINNE